MEAPGKEFLKIKFHACMCFCDLQCVWSPSGKTSLKINGLPLLQRCLMSLEQIPPLACDLSPTAIGVTGVEARARRWHPPPSPLILAQTGGAGQPRLGSTCQPLLAGRGQRFDLSQTVREIASFLGTTGNFPPQRLFWGLFSSQTFSIQLSLFLFARQILGWGDRIGQCMQ